MAWLQDELGNWYDDGSGSSASFDNNFWSDIGDIDVKYGSIDVPDLSTLPGADYSNEGRNYPTPGSTQGPGGSPVNSSVSGGGTNTLAGLRNLYKAITGGSGTDAQLSSLIPLLGGLYAANQSNKRTQPAGYQGGIPTYTATRQAPSLGQSLSGNVSFTTPEGRVVNPNSTSAPTATVPLGGLGGLAAALRGMGGARNSDMLAPAAGFISADGRYTPLGSDGRYLHEYARAINTPRTAPRAYDAPEANMRPVEGPAPEYEPKAAGGGLKTGGFIVPADVVSHLGNGSSDAGLKALATKLGATPIKGNGDGMSDSIPTSIDGREKALVAHEEAYLSPEKVARLGGGDAKKGAKKLRDMMARIREARTGTTAQGKQIDPSKFMPGGEVRRYVEGGATGVGAAAAAGVTGTESSLSNWAGPYVTDMLAKGKALSEMPFEQYQGPLTAGPSQLQTQAFNTAANLQTPAAIGQAANTAGGIASAAQNLNYSPVGADFTTDFAQKYMNPYLKTALDPQLQELQRQNQIANMADMSKLTRAGAYGGGRQAVLQAENTRNLMDKINQVTGQGYSTAYDKAMAQFNADQARKVQENQFGATYGLQGLQTGLQAAQTQGSLGLSQNQADLANLNAVSGLGATQRGIMSEDIAARKAAFDEARTNPYKMVQFQQSLLQGLPLAAQTYNMQDTNNLSQFMAGLATASDLLKRLGQVGDAATPVKP